MRTLLVIATAMALALPIIARAERRGAMPTGGGQVVHSRRAPVALHRAVPPYRGVHVYQGRQ